MTTAARLDQRLTVLFDQSLMKALRDEAKRTGETLGDLTREAVADLLMRRAQTEAK